ncbi:MAG: helix-turn-helix transcriptional regulator [bacterium]|nr:helix-turn-helix transcriptional regulator [bacterium]
MKQNKETNFVFKFIQEYKPSFLQKKTNTIRKNKQNTLTVTPLLFILCSLFFTGACANTGKDLHIREWSVWYSQDSSLKKASLQEEWQQLEFPAMFRLPYKPVDGFQHIWLRGEFTAAESPEQYYGLSCGLVYYTNVTYINGHKIGEYTQQEMHSLHHPGNYKIPAGIINPGKNHLYIYLGTFGKEYGGIPGSVRLLDRETFIKQRILDRFIFLQLPVGIIIFLMGQVIFHLIFFIWNRKELINIHTVAIFACWIWYIFLVFPPYFPFSNDFRITFLWACPSLFSIFYFLFIQSFYKIYLSNYNRVIIPVLLLVSGIIIFNPNTISNGYPARILGTISMFSVIFLLIHTIYKLNTIKPDRAVYLLIIFGICPGAFIAWDVVNYLWIFHYPPLTHTYTIPLFSIIVIIRIIREHIKNKIDLNTLYQKLERPEKSAARKMTITSSTEEKLEQIIAFLKENYMSDISREGLAHSTGISPDHMSRMFLAYTGKKINDYINELRIEQAAKELRETNRKIIEIAFSTGFESLATFNRIFLKITGQTPSEYRKINS